MWASSGPKPVFTSSVFTGNKAASGNGGAVALYSNVEAQFDLNRFNNNRT